MSLLARLASGQPKKTFGPAPLDAIAVGPGRLSTLFCQITTHLDYESPFMWPLLNVPTW